MQMRHSRGFTLAEMMLVITMASAMTLILLSSYDDLINDWRERQLVREASHLLALYRLTGQQGVAWQVPASASEEESELGAEAGSETGTESSSEPEPEPPAWIAAFQSASAQPASGLQALRERLAALPNSTFHARLQASVAGGADPVQRYALDAQGQFPALTIQTALRHLPYGATPVQPGSHHYRLHYRVSRPDQLAYLMPARVERQVFSLGEAAE